MRRTITSVTLAAALVLLAACTSDGDRSDSTTPTPTRTSTPSSSSSPSTLVQPSSVPTSVANSVALRQSVTLSSCAKAGAGWKAGGTARNTRDSTLRYRITVFFTTPSATVIGFGSTTVKVAAGKSATWSVTGKLTPVAGTKCVLRGVGKG